MGIVSAVCVCGAIGMAWVAAAPKMLTPMTNPREQSLVNGFLRTFLHSRQTRMQHSFLVLRDNNERNTSTKKASVNSASLPARNSARYNL
jgi:hypothetical protein